MPSRHLTDELILAFAAGELDGAEADRVAAAVAADPDAARRVELYRLAQRRTATDDSVAPPATLVERARGIFRPAAPTALAGTLAGWLDAAVAAVAQLAYDSRVQPATVRFHGADDRFQLTYETDDAEVDLRAERIEDDEHDDHDDHRARWRIVGQLVADGDTGVVDVVVLPGADAAGAAPVVSTRSDERSLFTFELDPGRYEVRLRVGDRTIALPDLHIE